MATSNKSNTPPSDRAMRSVLDRIRKAREEYASAPGGEEELSRIAADEAAARDAYREQLDRNQMRSLAEQIGGGLMRLGAAEQARRRGVNIDNVQNLPGTDYGAEDERAHRLLRSDLADADARRRSVADRVEQGRRAYKDQLEALGMDLGLEERVYREGMDTYRHGLRDEAAFRRAEESAARTEGRQKEIADRELRRLQANDLRDRIREAQKAQEAAVAAVNVISSQEDLSPKSLNKLEAQMPGILGRAGITPEKLKDIEDRSKEKGFLGIKSVNEDTRRKKLKEELVDPHEKRITTLRQALDQVLSTGEAPAGSGQSAPPPARIRVRSPEGKIGTLPESEIDQALSEGYTLVK